MSNTDSRFNSRVPPGPIEQKWDRFKFDMKLVNPANKRKYTVIVVGTGLGGAASAASLAELGYKVKAFCIHDSPRRAHSIAAQGGINAAKNYQNDGDSVGRLFYDTIKGGDYRSREANVYRLAQLSTNIIDQCVAQGVPFAREYSGELANRSFGGTQVSRTFYARGQTGQQLLLGAYGALMRQVDAGSVQLFSRREMLDLVVIDGRARGIIVRNLLTGEIESHVADSVVLATGGYGRIYYLSTNAHNSNGTAIWRAHKRGAYFANPCFTQIHPTCIPVSGDYQSKLTLMSESLRNDGRVWVPKRKDDTKKNPNDIPEEDRDYYLERKYPSFGNLVPRDVASRNAKEVCDEGRGVGESGLAVNLDFRDAIKRLGENVVRERYGNLFDMYREITDENPYEVPMRIYPAIHYTMGGLWVDYALMSNIPGLFVAGEANFSDHGANRLGASALMQGLADGYFVIPFTVGDYLADQAPTKIQVDHAEFKSAQAKVKTEMNDYLAKSATAKKSVMEFYRELGLLVWDHVGMGRTETGLKQAIEKIHALRQEFHRDGAKIGGSGETLNKNLEFAGRVADYLELGELMARDALERSESCGGHFREESQTEEGEAKRDDSKFSYVAAWEWAGRDKPQKLHKEALIFENVKIAQRSYK
jgi:succinate dehydrogenase / fumarate reductase flavoprotein subunit